MASCNGLVWPWVMVRSAITISCGLIQYSLIAECCNIMMVLILNVPDLAQSSFTVYAASADLRVAEPTAIGLAVGTTSVRRSTASGRGFAPHAVASSARCAAGYISEQESSPPPHSSFPHLQPVYWGSCHAIGAGQVPPAYSSDRS